MQQSRKRKRLLDDVKAALSVCASSHFVPVSVDMENVESGQGEKIDLRKGTFATQHQSKKFTDEDVAHFALRLLKTTVMHLYITFTDCVSLLNF